MGGRIFKYLVVTGILVLISACSSVGLQGEKRNDFSQKDRELILSFYGKYAPPPTPGPENHRAKAAQLKGPVKNQQVMSKKLARGAGFPLPRTLEASLSALESGYGRVMVGWNVVVVDLNSRKVVDRVHAQGY